MDYVFDTRTNTGHLLTGLKPHTKYTAAVIERSDDLPKDARLVTDAERGWAEKPEGLRHRNRNTDRYWYPTAKKVRERNEWNPEFEYAISKDTVLRPRAEEGRRHVTEEERRTKAKPDCARGWEDVTNSWKSVTANGLWHRNQPFYSIPADHVWAEDAKWKDADDKTRRYCEMPEGAERWDEGRGWCPCRGYMWDSGGVSIRYPASAQLTPRPKDGCHTASENERDNIPEGSWWWNETTREWRNCGCVSKYIKPDNAPICCPDAPVVTPWEPPNLVVDQVIQIPRFGVNRTAVYRVTGVYYGGEGQESLIGIEVLDLLNGTESGRDVDEMLVPVCVLCAALNSGDELKPCGKEAHNA